MKKILLIVILAAFLAAGQDLTVADTLIRTSVDTLNDRVDTLVSTTISTYHDTLVSVYNVDTAVSSINTPIDTPIDTPINTSINTNINTDTSLAVIERSRNVDTSINTTINTDTSVNKSKKIFLLPSYTFHAVFLAASLALIAATLYFFLARRGRDDSKRFLTTTRLSVLDKLVQRGCRHIEANYPDPALTPEAVCNSLVTGKAYLDALFMNELGINVRDFIVQVRVNAIKNRLAEAARAGQAPDVEAVCAGCGFADRPEAERSFAAVCGGVGIAEFARFSKMQNQRR